MKLHIDTSNCTSCLDGSHYFKEKNPYLEAEIEQILLDNGYRYDKSEDIYIEDEDVFLIYYYV